MGCGVYSEYESTANEQRYSKTNQDQCSVSGGGKSDGKVRVFKQEAASDGLAVPEAEDEQHTQDCVLEFKNISSTRVFIS